MCRLARDWQAARCQGRRKTLTNADANEEPDYALVIDLDRCVSCGGLPHQMGRHRSLLESSGRVASAVMGTEYRLLAAWQSVIAVVLLFVAVWIVLRLFALLVAVLAFLERGRTALSRYFRTATRTPRIRRAGRRVVALASAKGRLAMAKAQRQTNNLETS